jgi:hypothetical protein
MRRAAEATFTTPQTAARRIPARLFRWRGISDNVVASRYGSCSVPGTLAGPGIDAARHSTGSLEKDAIDA